MSDKLLALRHKKEAGEPFEEDDEVLAFKEYKEIEARKNGVNFESVGEVIRTKSADKMIKPGRLAHLILPEPENNPVPPNIRTINIVAKVLVQDQKPTLSEHTTNMSDLGLLNTIIGKYVRINVRKYKEMNYFASTVGDLIHKEESLYALNMIA
ncbi:hypothetical protein C1646_750752 [Rhizophagus diaphanus]|nr:hypothetical protein C1646_750752 [Rhizophagus diaphanus] [Rhizophagus sp. MUCL 43196]